MCDGQGVDPDPPSSPFIFDGMIQEDPKDVVHHLGYFLLLWVLGVDVTEGEHPVLPHRALQQTADANTPADNQSCSTAIISKCNSHYVKPNGDENGSFCAPTVGFHGCY